MNNASFFTADRTTHLKIVVMALVLSTAVIGVGITARINADPHVASAVPVKAGKPVLAGGVTANTVR